MAARSRPVLLAAAVATLALAPMPALGAGAPRGTESYPVLLRQIAGRQVRSARINPKAHDVRVTLRSGRHEVVIYPSRQERALATRLRARGASVTVLRRHHTKNARHTAGHVIRYVLGGLVVGLLVLWGIVWLLRTRRSRRAGRTR